MNENKNDQHPKQPAYNSSQQSIQNSSDSNLNTPNIKKQEVEEIEELNVIITEQRKPQFRLSENYGRRNH